MVGSFHADSYVDSFHPADPDHSASGRSNHGSGHDSISMFTVTLILFIITAFASATHDIAADGFYMLALKSGEQAEFVGIRSTFYRLASIFGQGVLVAIAGAIELKYDNIPLSWTITMLVTAVMFSAVSFYHLFMIPKPSSDKSVLAPGTAGARPFSRSSDALSPPILPNRVYCLPLYSCCSTVCPRHSSSRCACLSSLPVKGGRLRAFHGGSRHRIRHYRCDIPHIGRYSRRHIRIAHRIEEIHLVDGGMYDTSCLTFVYLAICQPENLFAISTAIAIEQFGYGFGFTAYMLYDVFLRRRVQDIHYAICTAFMALSMMIPGMFAGYIQEAIGYTNFFWMVIACCIATVIVTVLPTGG